MLGFVQFLLLLPRNVGVLLIRAYRATISPLYGDVCRYHPSCSAYGLGSVQQRGLIVGSMLTAWRIVRCNPWSRGGVDDVRVATHRRYRITPFGWVLPASWVARPRHAASSRTRLARPSTATTAGAAVTVPRSPASTRKD